MRRRGEIDRGAHVEGDGVVVLARGRPEAAKFERRSSPVLGKMEKNPSASVSPSEILCTEGLTTTPRSSWCWRIPFDGTLSTALR